MMNRRGVTLVDTLLLSTIAALLLLTLFLVDDVMDTYHREACYENQIGWDKLLWDLCYEHKREIWEVALAYTIKYPDDRAPVMVVLFNPNLAQKHPKKKVVVVDLSKQRWTTDQVCPLHRDETNVPIIDYWFALGRWHCLHNRYHSE